MSYEQNFKPPSLVYSFVYGVVGFPIFIWLSAIIDSHFNSQFIDFAWAVIGFLIPVLLCTLNIRYMRNRKKSGEIFIIRVRLTREDVKYLLNPGLERIVIIFMSAMFTVLMLMVFGIRIS